MKFVHRRSGSNVRQRLGRTFQSFAHRAGIMRLSAGPASRSGAIILMYHTIADGAAQSCVDPRNHVPAEVFAAQMKFLARHRRVVPLSDILDSVERNVAPPAGTIAITFDDGYLDNLTVAAPILAAHDLPATLFLPTAMIDRQEPQWVDQVWMAFRDVQRGTLRWGEGTDQEQTFDLGVSADREAARAKVGADLLVASPAERTRLLECLHAEIPAPPEVAPLTMSWSDVQTLLARYPGFEIGGHTMEHTAMTAVSAAEATSEIAGCRAAIEQRIGRQPQHFSFPYGRTSSPLREIVREAGFRSACGSGGGTGPVIRPGVNLYALPRVEAPSTMKRFALLTDNVNNGLWRRLGR